MGATLVAEVAATSGKWQNGYVQHGQVNLCGNVAVGQENGANSACR